MAGAAMVDDLIEASHHLLKSLLLTGDALSVVVEHGHFLLGDVQGLLEGREATIIASL